LAEQFGIPQVYSGYKVEQLIQSDQVDVVHVTSPNRHHHAQALEICKKAKRRKK
jgi:predicted dehydrogenase